MTCTREPGRFGDDALTCKALKWLRHFPPQHLSPMTISESGQPTRPTKQHSPTEPREPAEPRDSVKPARPTQAARPLTPPETSWEKAERETAKRKRKDDDPTPIRGPLRSRDEVDAFIDRLLSK